MLVKWGHFLIWGEGGGGNLSYYGKKSTNCFETALKLNL